MDPKLSSVECVLSIYEALLALLGSGVRYSLRLMHSSFSGIRHDQGNSPSVWNSLLHRIYIFLLYLVSYISRIFSKPLKRGLLVSGYVSCLNLQFTGDLLSIKLNRKTTHHSCFLRHLSVCWVLAMSTRNLML